MFNTQHQLSRVAVWLDSGQRARRRVAVLALLAGGLFLAAPMPQAIAATLNEALASAYADNPELNAERARLRGTDEGVPQALSGWRPNISAAADAGRLRQDTKLESGVTSSGFGGGVNYLSPRGFSITVSQSIFSGFQTINSTRQAEAFMRAGREVLLNVEQNVLFSAVDAYMNVLRDQSILDLQRNNVKVLSEQLRATQDRFSVGEVTRTDVAQAEARLSGAVSAVSLAEANLATSRANYRRVVGHEVGALSAPQLPNTLLPQGLNDGAMIADVEHPAIRANLFAEEAATFAVDVTIGDLLPTVSVDATFSKRYEPSTSTAESEVAQVVGRINVPIYQRGEVSSRVRQAKQERAQARLELDLARRQVRAAVVSAWGQLEAIRAQIRSDKAQVAANEVALAGVREEAKVGQRTTLDVLDAEQELLDSRVALVTSQRDNAVATYALLQAVGRLNARKLGLRVQYYDPTQYYQKVRNKWFGLGGANNE